MTLSVQTVGGKRYFVGKLQLIAKGCEKASEVRSPIANVGCDELTHSVTPDFFCLLSIISIAAGTETPHTPRTMASAIECLKCEARRTSSITPAVYMGANRRIGFTMNHDLKGFKGEAG